jgi:hypothetical protein
MILGALKGALTSWASWMIVITVITALGLFGHFFIEELTEELEHPRKKKPKELKRVPLDKLPGQKYLPTIQYITVDDLDNQGRHVRRKNLSKEKEQMAELMVAEYGLSQGTAEAITQAELRNCATPIDSLDAGQWKNLIRGAAMVEFLTSKGRVGKTLAGTALAKDKHILEIKQGLERYDIGTEVLNDFMGTLDKNDLDVDGRSVAAASWACKAIQWHIEAKGNTPTNKPEVGRYVRELFLSNSSQNAINALQDWRMRLQTGAPYG